MSEWKDVVRNSHDCKWKVVVLRAGEADIVQEVPFPDTAEAGGLIVSTVEPCHVLIPSKTTAQTTARITAMSNHMFVAVSEGTVLWGDHQLRMGSTRFDGRPLKVGEHHVTIDWFRTRPGDESAEPPG
jgi:hypothetical protein